MTESIALDVRLQPFVRRDTPRRWVATCPVVGVVSQGKPAARDRARARGVSREQVFAFLEEASPALLAKIA